MAVDILTEKSTSEQPISRPNHERSQTAPSSGRLWVRGFVFLTVIGLIVFAASFISSAATTDDDGPKLTHTISRGDLTVTVTEQGTLESSSNTEIRCKVRGSSTVLWVIETGTTVEPGDELVRLDKSALEDRINEQKIVYQRALATHTQSETAVAVAEIAITEYLEGTFRSSMQLLQKDLAIAQSNLRTAQNMLEHTKRMFKKGYTSELEVEGNEFSLEQAKLELDLKKTEIDVLERFTKAKQLEELQSTLKAAKATLASDAAALELEKARLDREEQQLENCVITAPAAGMVIYPSAADWKSSPDIEEGATVREDQVLLLIPDLSQMQVKVGIHESKVDRLKIDMPARVQLLDTSLDGNVSEIAAVTKPAGWWTGNVVKYDTIVQLDSQDDLNLKPGMSVGVQIELADYNDVLLIPVAAHVEYDSQSYCWVTGPNGPERRLIDIGDTNDQFIIVETGLKGGDEVIINPRAHIEEARIEALKPVEETDGKTADDGKAHSGGDTKPKKPAGADAESKPNRKKQDGEKKPAAAAADPIKKLLEASDENGDGVLTKDEYADEHKQYFDQTDTNGDGQVDLQELRTVIKAMQKAGGAE